ncbi:unnamed protein product, partial [Choristocarpus tenellus]
MVPVPPVKTESATTSQVTTSQITNKPALTLVLPTQTKSPPPLLAPLSAPAQSSAQSPAQVLSQTWQASVPHSSAGTAAPSRGSDSHLLQAPPADAEKPSTGGGRPKGGGGALSLSRPVASVTQSSSVSGSNINPPSAPTSTSP